MDSPVWALMFVAIIFTFTFGAFDIQRKMEMKHETFETMRSASQNALIELSKDYEEFEELTTSQMVNEWLVNFADGNSISYDEIVLDFQVVENNPPVFLVTAKSKQNTGYFIANEQVIAKYRVGTTILSDERGQDSTYD